MEKQEEKELLKGDETVGVEPKVTSDLPVEEEICKDELAGKIEPTEKIALPEATQVESGEAILSSEKVNEDAPSDAVLLEEKGEDFQEVNLDPESEEAKKLIRRTKQNWWAEKSKGMKVLFGLIPVLLIALGLLTWSLAPVDNNRDQKQLFMVKKNQGAYEVIDNLSREGLVRSPMAMKLLFKVFHSSQEVQSGNYQFKKNMSGFSILSDLTSGKGKSYVVLAIPEGYTVDRIAALIESEGLGKAEDFKKLAKKTKNPFMADEPSQDVTYGVEGYLFPDTYHLYLEQPVEEELIPAMLANFDKQTKELRQNLKSGMTVEGWVNLASLVEREVRKKSEQEKVAGIFWTRNQIGMALQSCASIQYILGEPKLELTIADTQIQSPYNTYLHGGFPPGPVSNPGLSALKASQEPEEAKELFFVAKSDGSHIFSRTYEEHLIAIEEADKTY